MKQICESISRLFALWVVIAALAQAFTWFLPAIAQAVEPSATVKVTPLLKTTESWNHNPIAYPTGKAEITSMLVEIAPGAETGWHLHPVPTFGYLLEGSLEVTLKDGRVKKIQPGEAMVEVMNMLHNGRNVGPIPVKILVFYAGEEGQPLTVKEEYVD